MVISTIAAVKQSQRVWAIFNFYNRWVDATGVQDMPALGYQMSGRRLATEGYARPEDEGPPLSGEGRP